MKVLALAPRMESTLPEFLRPVVKGRIALISRMSAGGDSDKVVQLNDSAVLEAMLKKYGIE